MTATQPITGAELVVCALERYGVQHVFGNPGTTELPVVRAVAESDQLDYVVALQEDVAVGMAAGYAKTRQYHAHHDEDVNPVGFVNLHAAPGLAHGLGNLHGASYAGAPVVVTAGIQETAFRHEEPMLSGDLVAMTRQFTKWSDTVTHVDALAPMLRRAVRVAATPPTGPVFLGLPLDVVLAETTADPEPLGWIPDAGRGAPRDVDRATEALVAADAPVMVVGDHVARAGRDAVDAAVAFAEAVGARVHGEILAVEANFPGDHDLWHSFLPPDGAVARRRMDTDTLVLVGCSTNTTITAARAPLVAADSTVVHVGPDPWELGKNVRADVAVRGDPGLVLSEVTERVRERLPEEERDRRLDVARRDPDGDGESAVDGDESAGGGELADEGDEAADEGTARPTKADLADAIRSVAPDAFVVDESVTTKYVFLERFPVAPEQFLSSKGGGLGYGLPAAVGAALAEHLRPNPRDVVGLVGDGSFLYYPHALYTAARYDVDLTVVVSDNRSYGVLRNNAADMLGAPSADDLYDRMGISLGSLVDVPGMAESQSVPAVGVTDRRDVPPAVEAAIDEPGPSLVDVAIRD